MATINEKITLGLDMTKSAAQINADIKKLQSQLKQLKTVGTLDAAQTARQINTQISALQAQLKAVRISASLDTGEAGKAARETGEAIAQNITAGISQASAEAERQAQELAERAAQASLRAGSESGAAVLEAAGAAREAGTQIQESAKAGISWAGRLKAAWQKLGSSKLASGIKNRLLGRLQQMPKEVYEIDAAMAKLRRSTDETDRKYRQFLDSACDSAGRLGRSVSSLIGLTASLAESGLSLNDAGQLAGISSIYANISGTNDSTAARDILAAAEAFHIQASDAMEVADRLSRLGSEYAASTAALGEGLSRSAAAMAAGGTGMDEALAMLAGGSEITGNAPEFGSFLAASSMRLRGMRDELAALGEEAGSAASSIGMAQAQILSLTEGKVSILDSAGNARAYYDVMKDISEIYGSLSGTGKAGLSELLFGSQWESQGNALIQAFQSGQVQKALEASLNSRGTAMAQQERWLESLEAKTLQFEAAFQSLSSTVLDSSLLKWFVDFGTGCVRALDAVAGTLGSLGSLGLGAGIFAGIKNVGSPKMSGLSNEYTDSMPVLPDTAV